MIELLDNVLQFFIDNAPDCLHKAKYSAIQERSLGLGAMGFHDYLMQKDIPFDSKEASKVNIEIFKHIKLKALIKTTELAYTRGNYKDCDGYTSSPKARNAHLLAIAPNANSSIIASTSPSIEPRSSNCYTHKTRVGSFLVKNPILKNLLMSLNKDNKKVWKSIMNNSGSVQHLDFLTDHQKDVFKTAFEIDQNSIIRLAKERQPFICQGQSVNLFFESYADKEYVNEVHYNAFRAMTDKEHPLKSLYYLRTKAVSNIEQINNKIEINPLALAKQRALAGECDIACHA